MKEIKQFIAVLGVLGALLSFAPVNADETLFVATPLTKPEEFTPGIEGPNCDARGNIYAVNFQKQGTIGLVTPQGIGSVYVVLPEGSVGNGIVFDRRGNLYVADYTRHNILVIDPASRRVRVFAHEAAMSQPNDLAIAADGTLFASDPNWKNATGRIWRIDPDGKVTLAADRQGTSNGIEVSPDGKTLFVNESDQRNIWRFTITADKRLADRQLVRKFDDRGFDGMRADVDGNLYVSCIGHGTVMKMTPDGTILHDVRVLGKRPSNVCFGGPDGRTVYVTEVEHTRLVQFRVDRPGLAWQRFRD
jgi:sugar lactone lactonase YvrE